MTDKTDKKEPLFNSEEILPLAERLMGKWFRICEEAEPEDVKHECVVFWHGMKALQKLALACNNSRSRDGATYFSIAVGNEMRRVSLYIMDKVGEDPYEW